MEVSLVYLASFRSRKMEASLVYLTSFRLGRTS